MTDADEIDIYISRVQLPVERVKDSTRFEVELVTVRKYDDDL